jgi:hypothetical protein
MNTTVKKPKDQGLSRVKKAMDSKQNQLSMWEIDFVRMSCCILDLNSEEVINRIAKRALEKGCGQAKRVMASTYDDMDAPGRSLAYLQTCVRGLRDATIGGFSKGIKVAKIAVENAIEDFKFTVTRTADACKWRHGVAEEWYAKGEEVCRNLLEEAEQALKEAKAREAAEAKVQLMESECEEFVSLAEQVEKQAASETEPEPLIKLAEEMEHKKGNVESLGQFAEGNHTR